MFIATCSVRAISSSPGSRDGAPFHGALTLRAGRSPSGMTVPVERLKRRSSCRRERVGFSAVVDA